MMCLFYIYPFGVLCVKCQPCVQVCRCVFIFSSLSPSLFSPSDRRLCPLSVLCPPALMTPSGSVCVSPRARGSDAASFARAVPAALADPRGF